MKNLDRQDRAIVPPLKWPGGKRWLLRHGLPTPPSYKRLIEPFLGGASVFFALNPNSALISDINPELINFYTVLRDHPEELADALRGHQRLHDKSHYYEVRSQLIGTPVALAARTLYLNRTCWNGLYRLNREGHFNVPMGTKNKVCMETDNFPLISDRLQNAEIKCQDFEQAVNQSVDGDFLFVDPPYTVKHNMNGFVKYNENIFRWEDQLRLADSLKRAADRGVFIALTNADHDSVKELYSSRFAVRVIERQSVLSGLRAGRGLITETLITANM